MGWHPFPFWKGMPSPAHPLHNRVRFAEFFINLRFVTLNG